MKYYAFLKAVNVGGAASLDMAELRRLLSEAGYGPVLSHLRSGNLVLESSRGKEGTVEAIGDLVESRFGLRTAVFLRTQEELSLIIEMAPFTPEQDDKSKQLVYLLSRGVTEESCLALGKDPRVAEDFHPRADLLYVYYHNGVGRSKLTTGYIDKVLGLAATGRNMNTIEALVRL